MRISDWSSDVCSSDLDRTKPLHPGEDETAVFFGAEIAGIDKRGRARIWAGETDRAAALRAQLIGRCHEARIRRQPGSHAIGAEQQQIGLGIGAALRAVRARSEEHTSELQSLMRSSYAVFCLKKKKNTPKDRETRII